MERLDIFIRAGDRSQADRVIQALAHTPLSQDAYQPGLMTDFLVAHGEWDLARHLMDACPFATPASGDIFVAHFENASSFPNLDRWLTYRDRLVPGFWSPVYLEYRRAMGTLRPLLDARAADVRAHPQDFRRIEAYLAVASRFEHPPNIAWLSTVCHFPLAIENLKMGAKLDGPFAAIAIPFLERARKLPITFDDSVWLEVQSGAATADFRDEPTPEMIRLMITSVLLERYKTAQQFRKARTLLEEITAQVPNGLPEKFAQFAGWMQGGPGIRSLGQQIHAARVENKSDYHYWLTRANYYIERRERDHADQAYQKALELTRTLPGATDWDRIPVMYAYIDFLYDQKHPEPTVNWLRSELEKAPIAGAYFRALVDQVVRLLPSNRPDFLPTIEALWRYLAANKTWAEQETRVLQEMIDTVQGADREPIWTRAEKLAGSDPDRERSLASLMLSRKETARALPLLHDVVRQTQNQADRNAIVLATLYTALARNDWPQMKALWPAFRSSLNRDDLAHWTQTLLDAAARYGASDDAMELFTAWTRYDHNVYHEVGNGNWKVGFVTRLARLGLRERLLRFYHAMAVADPESHVPQDILPVLLNPPPSVPQRGGPPFPGNPFPPNL